MSSAAEGIPFKPNFILSDRCFLCGIMASRHASSFLSGALAVLVAVGGGVIIRFEKIEGDYLIGFLLLQLANATFAAGQVLCRQLLACYPTQQPLHRFFGHFFLGALVLAGPSFLLFGNASRMPHTAMQWGVLVWMGLFATALGMYWWVKGSTRVDAGTLAIMNELHVPAGLLVNLLIWNHNANLPKLALGGGVILASLWLNRMGRRMSRTALLASAKH